MKYEVKGVDKLVKQLQQLSKTQVKAAIRKGSREGCKIVKSVAAASTPTVTGALKRSLKVRALPRSRRWIGTKVTMDLRYAAFFNLGTLNTVAKPVMRNAAIDNKATIQERMIDEVDKQIQKTIKGGL